MGTAVKTLQKLCEVVNAAGGVAGGLFNGKGPGKSRGGKEYGAMQQTKHGGSFPPGFGETDKQKRAVGGQLGGNKPQCFICNKFGHTAKNYPST